MRWSAPARNNFSYRRKITIKREEFYKGALDCLKEIQITLQTELEEIGGNLERIADSMEKQCTTLNRVEQGLSHEICMGIRKGAFGINAKDGETMMQAVWAVESLADKVGNIDDALLKIHETLERLRPKDPDEKTPTES